MDKLDAASADTGVVERLVLGPLRPTYSTDVRCTVGHNNITCEILLLQ